MNVSRIELKIHVIADDVPQSNLVSLGSDIGEASSSKEIKINRTPTGYSVIYVADEFMRLDLKKFLISLADIFKRNLPNTEIGIGVQYDYMEMLHDHYDARIDGRVIELKKLLDIIDKPNDEIMEEPIYDDEDDWFESIPEDDDDEEEPFDRFLENDKQKEHMYYGKSRAFTDAKNAKRDVHRHGIIVASKSDIKKDRKILKKFLNEFIPGKAGWKKSFREDILNRWMNMYCVSKSDLRQLEKNYSKKHKSGKEKRITRAINQTTRIFSNAADAWYDPNR